MIKRYVKKIYVFDIDGTLTPSRLKMTKEFAKYFDKWSKRNKYYLVTGSDLDKTKEQLPIAYIDRAEAIFTCCGNQMWRGDELICNNKFKPPQNLLSYLGEELNMSNYHHRAGNHIEDRGSLLNFSVVGRNCSLMERENYFKWDNETGERKRISKYIREQWDDLDAVIGGQISIDIYPKGMDKSQVLNIIEQERLVKPDKYIFIGDRIEGGGNDYPLAKLMNKTDNCSTFQTDGWEHTIQILENLK